MPRHGQVCGAVCGAFAASALVDPAEDDDLLVEVPIEGVGVVDEVAQHLGVVGGGRPVQAPRGVLATTRVASFGAPLLGLSYFAGGFEGSAVESPLLDRVEAYSALVGILVVLGALVWQARGRE